jgi:hypothetical protein
MDIRHVESHGSKCCRIAQTHTRVAVLTCRSGLQVMWQQLHDSLLVAPSRKGGRLSSIQITHMQVIGCAHALDIDVHGALQ